MPIMQLTTAINAYRNSRVDRPMESDPANSTSCHASVPNASLKKAGLQEAPGKSVGLGNRRVLEGFTKIDIELRGVRGRSAVLWSPGMTPPPARSHRTRSFHGAISTFLVALLLCFRSPAAHADSRLDSIAAAVEALQFENVGVASTEDRVIVSYENRVYRDPLEAMGRLVSSAAALLDTGIVLEVRPLSRGIPVLSAAASAGDWLALLRGTMTADHFRTRLHVGDGSVAPANVLERATTGSSPWWKVDLAVRPITEIQLGIADDPFAMAFWVAPEAMLMPFRGALVTAQGIVEIEDEFDPFSRRIRPGRTTLSYGGWLPGSWLGTASIGYFPGNRYGVAFQTGRYIHGGDVEVRLSGDYSGFLKFSRNDVVLYSGLEAWSGVVSVVHRLSGLDLVTTASAGRFLYGDLGGSLDVARRFDETEFAFFAIKSDEGSVAGLRFRVALPVRRAAAPRRVRLTTVPDFPFEYREDTDLVGIRVNLYDDLSRLRQRLDPVFLRNNLDRLNDELGGTGVD
jgi:hypothetical protein